MLQGPLPTPLLTFLGSKMNSIEGSDGVGMQVFRDELIVIRNRVKGFGTKSKSSGSGCCRLSSIIGCLTNKLASYE